MRQKIFVKMLTSNEDPTGEEEESSRDKWPELNPGSSDLSVQAGLLLSPGAASSHHEGLELCVPHLHHALNLLGGEVVELHGSLVLHLPAEERLAQRSEEKVLAWLGLQVNQAGVGGVLEVSAEKFL